MSKDRQNQLAEFASNAWVQVIFYDSDWNPALDAQVTF